MAINEQEHLVQKIRTQYTQKAHTQLDELRALDRKVKRPAKIFAYTFGTLAALVMGGGMSLIMTDLAETLGIAAPMVPGLILGIAGMAMAIGNYPIYRRILTARQKKYADAVISLSNRITGV